MHSITRRFASYALVGVLILGCMGFVQGQIVSTGSFVPGAVRSISTSYKSHATFSSGKASVPLVSTNYRAQSGEIAVVQNPPHPSSSSGHIEADEGATVVLVHEDLQALTSFIDVDGDPLTFLVEAISGQLEQNGNVVTEAWVAEGDSVSWVTPLEAVDPDPYIVVTAYDPWVESGSQVIVDALNSLESGLAIGTDTGSVSGSSSQDFGEAEISEGSSQQTYTITNDAQSGTVLMAGPGMPVGGPLRLRAQVQPLQENTEVLIVSEIKLGGSHPADFVISGIDLPVTLQAGESTQFVISFAPGHAGDREAEVEIYREGGRRPLFNFGIRGKGNRPPTGGTDEVFRNPGLAPFRIRIADLLKNDYDMDGDTVEFGGFSTPTSMAGRTLSLTKENGEDFILYFPGLPDEMPDDSFVYRVSDGRGATAPSVVWIRDRGASPDVRLSPIDDVTMGEGAVVSFGLSASNGPFPPNTLTYRLDPGAPPGARVDAVTGRFFWQPDEADGPGTYPVTVRVTDSANPVRQAAQSFTINVTEFNRVPRLPPFRRQVARELEMLSIPLRGADDDLPKNELTYSLGPGAPQGLTLLQEAGLLQWTPEETDGPGVYEVTLRVRDDGTPNLQAVQTFNISVPEVNSVPRLPPVQDQTVTELETLTVQLMGTDDDVPPNKLTYSLAPGSPSGATLDPNTGQFQWTPGEADGPGLHSVTVNVVDNGQPPLETTQTFSISVLEANRPPRLESVEDTSIVELFPYSFQLKAADDDLPANVLTYSLESNAASGATIDAQTGLFQWQPGESQGPDNYTFTVRVTDDGNPAMAATVSFGISVVEDNTPPSLNAVGRQTISESEPWSLPFAAVDLDVPLNTLTFRLGGNVPEGAAIDPNSGVLSWEPKEDQGPGTYTFQVSVFDDADPALEDQVNVEIEVKEKNESPQFSAIPDASVQELNTLSITLLATDSDVPTNVLTYELGEGAPEGMTLSPETGLLTWTPTDEQGPATYNIQVLVKDDGDPQLGTVTTVNVNVVEENSAPVWEPIPPQQLLEGDTFSLNLVAVDPDVPPNNVTYQLISGPPNVLVDAETGVLTWTPGQDVVEGVYDIKVAAVDDGNPAGRSETEFTVEWVAVNDAPTLQGPVTVDFIEEIPGGIESISVFDEDVGEGVVELSLSVINGSLSMSVDPPAVLEGDETSRLLVSGTISQVNAALSTLTYSGNLDFYGRDLLSINANDRGQTGEGGSMEATLNVDLLVENVNDPPTADIPPVIMNEDVGLNRLGFSVVDSDSSGESIIVQVRVEPDTLFDPVEGVRLELVSAEEKTYSLKLVPLPNLFGEGTLFVEINDGDATTQLEIPVTVRPVNDPPVIQPKPIQFFSSGGVEVSVPLNIRDEDDPMEALEVVATIDSGEFIVPGSLRTQFVDGQWEIKLTPLAGQVGTTRINVTVSDGIQSSSIYFNANFNVGNSPPVVTFPDSLSVNEDESIIVLVPVVDDLMMSDELLFSITANPASLIGENDVTLKPVEGGVQLQVHARPDQHGLGSITLVVDDTIHQVSGEIPVQVVPVADPPRIQPVADRTVVGNQPFEVEIQLSDPDSPLTDMQLLLESNYPELLPVDNALIAIAGSPTILSFTPSPGRFGIVEITVRVQALDGLSTEEAFQVQVTDPAREETPPVNLRLVRTNNGAPETLYLSWIGEMDVYVADQLLGPYRLVEGVSSPFQPAVEPDGKFYKLVPRSRP